MSEYRLAIVIDANGRPAVAAFDSVTGSVQRTERASGGLTAAMRQVKVAVAGVISAATIRELTQLADGYTNITSKLRLVTDGERDLVATREALFQSSQRTRTDFSSTAELYTRMVRATKDLSLSQRESLLITETINKAFVVSGASAEAANAAIIQLSQGLAAGALRGDEFNSVAEQAPILLDMVAASLGKTKAELRAMAADGKITADVIVDALLAGAQDLDAEFEQMALTIGGSMTTLSNSFERWLGQQNEALGITQAIAEAINFLAQNFDQITTVVGAGAEVLGLYLLLFKGIPLLYTTATAAGWGFVAMLQAKNVSLLASIQQIGLLRAAGGAMVAAFAGWQLGTWLRENFVEAQLAGIAFVNGTLTGWERIKQGAQIAWAAVTAAATGGINIIRTALADLVGFYAGISEAADVFGLGAGAVATLREFESALRPTTSASDEFNRALADINAEFDRNKAKIDGITDDMADFAIAEANAKKRTNELTEALGGSRGLAPAAGLTAEQLKKLRAEQDRFLKSVEDLEAMLSGPLAEAELRRDRGLAETEALLRRGVISTEAAARARRVYNEEFRRTKEVIDSTLAPHEQILRDLHEEQTLIGLNAEELHVANVLRAQRNALLQQGTALSDEDRQAILAETEALARQNFQMEQLAEASRTSAEASQRAWGTFFDDLGRAAAQGTRGIKDLWKRMVEDMKARLITSGLIKLFSSLFGGGSGGGGWGALAAGMVGMLGGGSASAGGFSGSSSGGGGMNWMSMLSTGRSGYNMLSGSSATPWYGFLGNPNSTMGGYAHAAGPWLAAAGGAYAGAQNRHNTGGRVAGAASYGALGYVGGSLALGAAAGAAGAAGMGAAAVGAGAAGGASMAAAAIPVIGWILAAIALVDMLSGGKLIGTKFQTRGAEQSFNLGADGGSASLTLQQERQRSLFRGIARREVDKPATAEMQDAARQLYEQNRQIVESVNRQLMGDVDGLLESSLRVVQRYSKKGKLESTKYFVDILGKSWEEASMELAQTRLGAEQMIWAIDQIMGNQVEQIAASIVDPLIGGIGGAIGGRRGEIGGRIGEIFGDVLRDGFDDISPGMGGPGNPPGGSTMGEASAIAQRWRGDAEALLQGAQFLLQIASDIRNGFDLLGAGTLLPIVNLVEELAYAGEPLIETYQRLATSTRLLEQALEMTGVTSERTREEIVRWANGIAEAAGGIDRAQQLWNTYFDTFFTAEERALYGLQQAQAFADTRLEAVGLSRDDVAGSDGMAAFRALFDEVLRTGSAEAVVQWLEAAEAINVLLGAEQALAQARGGFANGAEQIAAALAQLRWEDTYASMSELDRVLADFNAQWDAYAAEFAAMGATVEQLAELEELRARAMERATADIRAQIEDVLGGLRIDEAFAGMTAAEQQMARFNQQWDEYRARLVSLGATVAQLTELEGLREAALARQVAAERAAEQEAIRAGRMAMWEEQRRQREALEAERARLADAEARRLAQLGDLMYGLGWDDALRGMSDADRALAQLNRRWDQIVAQALALGASTAQLADIELYRQNALADLQAEQERRLLEEIERRYQAELQWIERLRGFRDSLLLDQQVSILTPEQRLAEALAQYEATLTGAEAGDADARAGFEAAAQAFLREARGFWGSDDPYTEIFQRVQADLNRMIGASSVTQAEDQTVSLLTRIADAVSPQPGTGVTLSVDIAPVTTHLRELRDEHREGTRALLVELREQVRQQNEQIRELRQVNSELRAIRDQPIMRTN